MRMPLSIGKSLMIIAVVSVVTFSTRVIPFLLFPKGKEIPPLVKYLGAVLPPAVIGMLVIYCLKSVNLFVWHQAAPELIAGLSVVALHIWKRNNLLSIGVGTVLYMFLIQQVFV